MPLHVAGKKATVAEDAAGVAGHVGRVAQVPGVNIIVQPEAAAMQVA